MKSELKETKNYGEFQFMTGNRPVRASGDKYQKLKASMAEHGWIKSFPATVISKSGKKLIIDGQNRYTAAKELGIPVVYVVVEKAYNIASVNEPFRQWSSADYAESHASYGNPNFQMLLNFSKENGVSPVRAAQLISSKHKSFGDSSGGAHSSVKDGSFVFLKDGAEYAKLCLKVAESLPKKLRKNRGLNAAISRILSLEEVDPDTLADKLSKHERFVSIKPTVEESIGMIEVIYNKRNLKPVPISMLLLERSRASK